MRCNHCNGEHPDNFKFCPVTGKEIEHPMKACSNPDCDNYEKHILPVEAKFCPKCGSALTGTAIKKKDIDMFFPIKEIYPDSKLSDVLKNASLYDQIEDVGCNCAYVDFSAGCAHFRDDRLDSIGFGLEGGMPSHLSKLGFSWTSSIDEWIRLLKQLKFTVLQIRKHNNTVHDGVHYHWQSIYVATASDQSVKIELTCSEGEDVIPTEPRVEGMALILPCYVGPFGDTYQNYELYYSYGDPIKAL